MLRIRGPWFDFLFRHQFVCGTLYPFVSLLIFPLFSFPWLHSSGWRDRRAHIWKECCPTNYSVAAIVNLSVIFLLTCGMFISSIKMSRRFPGGGPNVSLVLFSTLASRLRCTSRDVVREEKLTIRSRYVSLSSPVTRVRYKIKCIRAYRAFVWWGWETRGTVKLTQFTTHSEWIQRIIAKKLLRWQSIMLHSRGRC